ncbi:MAG: hypothetical protein R2751_08665 [Bacteroidales bacterium]
MQYENEVVMLFISGLGLLYLLLNLGFLRRIHRAPFLFGSFAFFVLSCIATNLERLVLPRFLNGLEHISNAASIALFVVWMVVFLSHEKQHQT